MAIFLLLLIAICVKIFPMSGGINMDRINMNNKKVKTDNLYVCMCVVELYDEDDYIYNKLEIPKIYEKTGNFIELEDNIYESFYDIETDNIAQVLDDKNVYLDCDDQTAHLEDFIKISTLLEEFDRISNKYKDIVNVNFKGYANLLKKKLDKETIKRDEVYALRKIIFTIHNYVYELKILFDEEFDLYETEVIDFNKYKKTRKRPK